MTRGEAALWKSNISPLISLMFVGAFACWMGLTIWKSATESDPLEKVFLTYYLSDIENTYTATH